jgi:hypothetical protein
MDRAAQENIKDGNFREAFKQLLRLQDTFGELVACAVADGAAVNETRDLENRIGQLEARNEAKALEAALSDLAAMGGRPTAAVLALTLDPRTRLAWLEAFYRGLAACARRYGVPIVGGDIAQADGVLAASLTLLGTATGPRVVTRTGARRGDALYVTGNLGRSLPSGHHFKFSPRLAEGAWLARQPAVRAMMDVSDGLAKDLHALTPSGAAPALDAVTLPLRRGADLRAAGPGCRPGAGTGRPACAPSRSGRRPHAGRPASPGSRGAWAPAGGLPDRDPLLLHPRRHRVQRAGDPLDLRGPAGGRRWRG